MNVLIPNKDTLVFLANVQRKILESYNSRFAPGSLAVPQFPLWAFFDFPSPKKCASCSLLFPCLDADEFFFPAELSFFSGGRIVTACLKIVFAAVRNSPAAAGCFSDESVQELFPRNERVFRTGEASVENNGWQLFSSVWHKC